ncbi:bifunctional DNA-formamidopyrimidine glycosylase/DNA-(apurinic or apyrimidinic site) lyase [Legionella maioricensis]|uniref:Formamidopyrimidine-DNA glycosylase n=1 Tax=Legionella maioricensis TaxID=2896528 RepID=A0A9X2D495_9GAMM|nr:bifunctional DNA-formamidopyrimidine glycosylase/DNA-(apurinic or apyrimidinic site) lyase [Legionella maioricensis]MCL9685272.1 bifunctional DNA-formamidopyrimidine glycosylase/DNA-(apurinic or apyrimidinic site) lyase [Legionella maioricensis]MCL9688489.1 bifunctional DNA-formamidopyrimidine glycosylase/DNA-(apurinic or apyrimidinic site) lyase [Legionella maioricensis]
MPELPEVETTKQGIKPHLEDQIITRIVVRNPKLRLPVPLNINELCAGKKIVALSRRAKYILLHLSQGYILIHLGMSGHLRIVPSDTPPAKHDHLDLIMTNGLSLRYCDPRRFGLFVYLHENPNQHPLLAHLGPEPLSQDFNSDYLYKRTRNKNISIKSLIMNNEIVVGVGNIYATESLFLTGIHPLTPANKITELVCHSLTMQIKQILKSAIEAGGTTLRDFYTFDGKPGYFSVALKVYGRKKQPCFQCNALIETVVIAGRHSAFCPQCQPPCH